MLAEPGRLIWVVNVDEAVMRAGRVRGLRRQLRWSQERLAEEAGLSVTTVKKAESGRGEVNTATLHAIARALGTTTNELYTDRAHVPVLAAEPDHQALASLRAVIAPPVGIAGAPVGITSTARVELSTIDRAVTHVEMSYRDDRYDDVAEALPGILARAHLAVAELDSNPAYQTRSRALQMAGRYLTQVRQFDLALAALHAAIRDAARAGDRTLAAIAVNGQGWALTRQGRLAECEELCTVTADEIEPRLSTASPDELAAWGNLLYRASAAAVRNNRHDRARELLRVSSAAASALGQEHESWATFGPLTIALKSAEYDLISGKPDLTLRAAEQLPDAREVGDVTPVNRNRHLLDVAHASLLTGDVDRATTVLTTVLQRAPEWLRRQRSAYEIVRATLKTRPKRPTEEMAALASHLGVAA
ncbi:MAG: helix-turn-helix domain-containing protein [Micromonosporaceae bacterium]